MKIDDKPILPAAYVVRSDVLTGIVENGTPNNGQSVAVQGEDKVRLSGNAERLARMSEALHQIPDMRVERVQELKKQIAAGEYQVSARDVAEKMLMTMKRGITA